MQNECLVEGSHMSGTLVGARDGIKKEFFLRLIVYRTPTILLTNLRSTSPSPIFGPDKYVPFKPPPSVSCTITVRTQTTPSRLILQPETSTPMKPPNSQPQFQSQPPPHHPFDLAPSSSSLNLASSSSCAS